MPREISDIFIAADCETTSLSPNSGQVIDFAGVWADRDTPLDRLPVFRRLIVYEKVVGQPYALQMNAGLLKAIAQRDPQYEFCTPDELAPQFRAWLEQQGLRSGQRLTFAGKNFAAFDLPFLKRLPGWDELIPYRHRIIDTGVLWWKSERDGFELPATAECKLRANLDDIVHHTSIDDALDVVELVRRFIQCRIAEATP